MGKISGRNSFTWFFWRPAATDRKSSKTVITFGEGGLSANPFRLFISSMPSTTWHVNERNQMGTSGTVSLWAPRRRWSAGSCLLPSGALRGAAGGAIGSCLSCPETGAGAHARGDTKWRAGAWGWASRGPCWRWCFRRSSANEGNRSGNRPNSPSILSRRYAPAGHSTNSNAGGEAIRRPTTTNLDRRESAADGAARTRSCSIVSSARASRAAGETPRSPHCRLRWAVACCARRTSEGEAMPGKRVREGALVPGIGRSERWAAKLLGWAEWPVRGWRRRDCRSEWFDRRAGIRPADGRGCSLRSSREQPCASQRARPPRFEAVISVRRDTREGDHLGKSNARISTALTLTKHCFSRAIGDTLSLSSLVRKWLSPPLDRRTKSLALLANRVFICTATGLLRRGRRREALRFLADRHPRNGRATPKSSKCRTTERARERERERRCRGSAGAGQTRR